MEENYFNISIFPVLMEKVLQEGFCCLVRNVSTDNDMPDVMEGAYFHIFILFVNFSMKPSPRFLLVGALIL